MGKKGRAALKESLRSYKYAAIWPKRVDLTLELVISASPTSILRGSARFLKIDLQTTPLSVFSATLSLGRWKSAQDAAGRIPRTSSPQTGAYRSAYAHGRMPGTEENPSAG